MSGRVASIFEKLEVDQDAARALGLVAVRNGHLSPTAAGRRGREDAVALWKHILNRLPLGKKDFDRQAGWMALAVASGGVPGNEWRGEISELLAALGWRSGRDSYSLPPAHSPTLDVLEELAGAAGTRWGRIEGIDPASRPPHAR